MTNKEYKLLLVVAAVQPNMLNGLQLKQAGGYWFLPWQHLFAMVEKGWLTVSKTPPSEHVMPASTYYRLTAEGRTALINEIDRRMHKV